MKLFKITTILFIAAFFVIACTQKDTSRNTSENANKPQNNKAKPEATVDELASGRKNFKEQCARCHKEDGTGGKVEIEGKMLTPENLTTDKMIKDPDEEYIEYMTKGIPDEGMPSFKDILSKEEMEEVVKFIRKEIQK